MSLTSETTVSQICREEYRQNQIRFTKYLEQNHDKDKISSLLGFLRPTHPHEHHHPPSGVKPIVDAQRQVFIHNGRTTPSWQGLKPHEVIIAHAFELSHQVKVMFLDKSLSDLLHLSSPLIDVNDSSLPRCIHDMNGDKYQCIAYPNGSKTVYIPVKFLGLSGSQRKQLSFADILLWRQLAIELIREGLPKLVYDEIVEWLCHCNPWENPSKRNFYDRIARKRSSCSLVAFEALRCDNLGTVLVTVKKWFSTPKSDCSFYWKSYALFFDDTNQVMDMYGSTRLGGIPGLSAALSYSYISTEMKKRAADPSYVFQRNGATQSQVQLDNEETSVDSDPDWNAPTIRSTRRRSARTRTLYQQQNSDTTPTQNASENSIKRARTLHAHSARNEDCQTEVEEIQDVLAERNSNINELQSTIDRQTEAMNALGQKLQEQEDDNQLLAETYQELEQTVRRLRGEIIRRDATNSELQSRIDSQTQDTNKLRQELQEAKAMREDEVTVRNGMDQQGTDDATLRAEISRLQKRLETLEAELPHRDWERSQLSKLQYERHLEANRG